MTAKEAVIQIVSQMPDDATAEGIIAELDARFGDADEADEGLTQQEWEDAWVEEVNRRVEDIRSGKSVGIPHEELMKQLREKYG